MIWQMFRLTWNRKGKSLLLWLEILISFLVVFALSAAGISALANYSRPLGFEHRGVWSVQFANSLQSNDGSTPEYMPRVQQMIASLRQMPEVLAVGASDVVPFGTSTRQTTWDVHGKIFEFEVDEASDEFARTLGIQLIAGRWFGPEDNGAARRSIVVTAGMAAKMFPGQDPLGRDFDAGDSESPDIYRVVGVIAEYRKHGELAMPFEHVFYRKALDDPKARAPESLVLKLAPGTPAGFEQSLTERLRSIAPDWRFDVQSLETARALLLQSSGAALFVIGSIAAFLLIMVVLGLTGVFWQSVGQRLAEIGLRRATGATACHVLLQIVGEVAALVTLAIAAGLLLIAQLPLFGISQQWLPAGRFAAAVAVSVAFLYLLAAVTALVPAYLAAGVAPAEALRAE